MSIVFSKNFLFFFCGVAILCKLKNVRALTRPFSSAYFALLLSLALLEALDLEVLTFDSLQ